MASLLLVAACGDETVAPERRCVGHDQCDDGFLCGPQGLCVVASDCARDADCCPGAACFSGWCRPTSECGPGRACLGLGEVCEGDQCVPAPCGAGEVCAGERVCVGGRCLAGAPCGGACGPGEVCDVASERCLAAPSCALTCAAGWRVAVASAPDPLACGEPACVCAAASAVPGGQPGVDGVLGAIEGGPADEPPVRLVSYDPVYGDLVLSRWDAGGGRHDVVLDGAPEGVAPVALADGYRGGVAAPGPDRGRRPAVAAGPGGRWDILYRDEDEAAVRHVVVDAATGRVEARARLDVDGDAGRYACLAREGSGALAGLVFVASDAADRVSRLVAVRQAGSGWEVSPVLETALPPRSEAPCAGACGLGEACVVDAAAGAEACADTLQLGGCEPACGALEVCGAIGPASAACHARVYARYEADRLPFGQGLFVTCTEGAAAWRDGDRRALVVARPPYGPADRLEVDAGPDRDGGHHATLGRTAAGGLVLAHHELVGDRLRVGVAADALGPWSFVDVAPGGAWARVAEVGGRAAIVFGEAGAGDVWLAARTDAGCWAAAPVLTDGVFVFPGLAAVGAGAAYVAALRYDFMDDLSPAHAPVLVRPALPASCAP